MNKRTLYNKNDLGRSFGLAVAVMLLAQFFLGLIFGMVMDDEPTLSNGEFWLLQTLYALCIGSTTFFYAALTKTNVLQATAMNRAPKFTHVGWGCAATLFLIAMMMPLNNLLMRLIVALGLPKPSVELPMQIVPMILVACVLASVTEELLFRGTLVRSLANDKNKLGTLAISGALFAHFHTNPAQTLHQFVLGAFLALLVLRSGSVWTTVLVHFFNNLVAVILSFTLPSEDIFVNYWYVFVPVGLVGFVACIFGYLKTTSDLWAHSEENECKMDVNSKVFLSAGIVLCAVLWICSLMGWL